MHPPNPRVALYGDFQPGNFMTDGEKITGYLDFESAAFRDVLHGLAKYRTHDLHPLNKAGAVNFYLDAHGITGASFAIRLAIWCLRTLCKEVPPAGGTGFAATEPISSANCSFLWRTSGSSTGRHATAIEDHGSSQRAK